MNIGYHQISGCKYKLKISICTHFYVYFLFTFAIFLTKATTMLHIEKLLQQNY